MDNERHALNNKKSEGWLLHLVEPGWGNLSLTVSNIEITDRDANHLMGTLTYDLDGYTVEDLERIGKTEKELMVHCNQIILEILESGLKKSADQEHEDMLNKLRDEL